MSAIREAATQQVDGEPADVTGRRLLASFCCAAFVLLAMAVEVLSGQAANSPGEAKFQPFAPLGWPAPVRVLWWLLVATAAAGHRVLLYGLHGARQRLSAALLAAPFVVFAVGIALGADWATWH